MSSSSPSAVRECTATIATKPRFTATQISYSVNPFFTIIKADEDVDANLSRSIAITLGVYIPLGDTPYEQGSEHFAHFAYSETTHQSGSSTTITYSGVDHSGGVTVIRSDPSNNAVHATFKLSVQKGNEPPLSVDALINYDPN
ncbi:hypothetical protein [Pseudomonas sp. Marseille-Q1929]|uniref:hypothetical protein n=1 Tax=Pseudomonas sp. Marseille-Q1929 TaxID=2730402 RepID=UPI001A8FEF5C|nr:hypothetical protein [Pseudomonas sp. Marseille-Q1929]MBO0491860.1 hypothetical protein [Pseudomonas sp. Marseille-Q1929]